MLWIQLIVVVVGAIIGKSGLNLIGDSFVVDVDKNPSSKKALAGVLLVVVGTAVIILGIEGKELWH